MVPLLNWGGKGRVGEKEGKNNWKWRDIGLLCLRETTKHSPLKMVHFEV